jgi:hypothetical protein
LAWSWSGHCGFGFYSGFGSAFDIFDPSSTQRVGRSGGFDFGYTYRAMSSWTWGYKVDFDGSQGFHGVFWSRRDRYNRIISKCGFEAIYIKKRDIVLEPDSCWYQPQPVEEILNKQVLEALSKE